MKRTLTLRGLLLATVLSATVALAAPNGLNGNWLGSAEAIYPDGSRVAGLMFDGTIYQETGSGLFHGSFTYTIADPYTQISGVITGYVGNGGELSGLLSVILDPDTAVAVATVEGKLTGNKIVAVTRDFSDGTTSILTAYRVR